MSEEHEVMPACPSTIPLKEKIDLEQLKMNVKYAFGELPKPSSFELGETSGLAADIINIALNASTVWHQFYEETSHSTARSIAKIIDYLIGEAEIIGNKYDLKGVDKKKIVLEIIEGIINSINIPVSIGFLKFLPDSVKQTIARKVIMIIANAAIDMIVEIINRYTKKNK